MRNSIISKINIIIIILAAMLLTFTACSFGDESSELSSESLESSASAEESSQKDGPEPTGPADPTDTPKPDPTGTPTPAPIDHTGHGLLREFDCLKTEETIDSITGLGKDIIAVSATTRAINGEFNDSDEQHSSLFLIDTANDSVKKTIEGVTVDERFIGADEKYGFVSNNLSENTVSIYSAGLEKIKTFENTGDDCFFEPESGKVYNISRNSLISIDTDGREEKLLEKTITTRLYGAGAGKGKLLLGDGSETGEHAKDIVFLNLSDMKTEDFLNGREVYKCFYCGENIVLIYLLPDSPDIESCPVSVFDAGNGELKTTFEVPNLPLVYSSPYSDRFVLVKGEINEENNTMKERLLLVNPEDGSYADMGVAIEDTNEPAVSYNRVTGHWLLGARVNDGGFKNYICEICPAGLKYDNRFESCDDPGEVESQKGAAGKQFAELRDEADKLEKEYGFKLLMGNEIKGETISLVYSPESIEDSGRSESEQAMLVRRALNILKKNLEAYPDWFFDMFKDYRGMGGIRFVFVENLRNDYGSFTPSGECAEAGCWINVVIDTDLINKIVVHHELWHATEALLEKLDPKVFDEEAWSRFNPEGFRYLNDTEKYNEVVNSGAYLENCRDSYYGDKEDVFLSRLYGITAAKEDRATIVEAFMGDEDFFDPLEADSGLEYIKSFPHLKEKVEYMEAACERLLGKKYW